MGDRLRYFTVEPPESIEALSRDHWFPKTNPRACVSIGADLEERLDWLPAVAQGASKALFLRWETTQRIVVLRPTSAAVQIEASPHLPFTLATFLARLATLDISVCSVGPLFDNWKRIMRRKRVHHPGLSKTHGLAGVAAAFKGKQGHGRLVSRRSLDYGPWALLRHEPSDLSVVLFHDPEETDSEKALNDAALGHFRMGLHPNGGYLTAGEQALEGTYLEEERRLIIIVAGRELRPGEMLDACLHRRDSQQSDTPIDTITFFFFDPEAAKQHLHELWLRELECRTLVDGVELRLDEDYVPKPASPPAWASRVREKWENVLSGQ